MSFPNDHLDEFYDPCDDYHHCTHKHPFVFSGRNYCPCPRRFLQEESNGTTSTTTDDETSSSEPVETWEVVVTCVTIFLMFATLIGDLAGADSIMLTALTVFLVTEIISVGEGLAGFANEGLLTVLILFVVAEGISRTGALDWYMGKLLGRPKSVGSAQVRLMVPIAIVSAFLNNTPVVAVMIPIVQRWGKNNFINPKQLLIPLSFASIFGGTCTLIGTSTNLIVNGLLEERYADSPDPISIGLFDLGEYGIPVALVGMTYLLVASPFLIPGGKGGDGGNNPLEDNEDVLLGARLTQWSPACGRSVKRSGLRDTGGIYLVSVHRFATGNVHRAVGQDFVLNAGDILYFTGLVEGFGAFCEEHGLEMITNEIQDTIHESERHEIVATASKPQPADIEAELNGPASSACGVEENDADQIEAPVFAHTAAPLETLHEDKDALLDIPVEIGTTRESLIFADNADRLRIINRLTDNIRGIERDESKNIGPGSVRSQSVTRSVIGSAKQRAPSTTRMAMQEAPKVVVTIEKDLVVVGVDSRDRPGLLLDISKGLLTFNLQLHHTEAAVVNGRSLSIWRCEPIGTEIADVEQIWTLLTVGDQHFALFNFVSFFSF